MRRTVAQAPPQVAAQKQDYVLGDVLNIPNLITVLGYGAGAAWALGGPWWLAAFSIIADEADHHVAKLLGDDAHIQAKLDGAVDVAMVGLALQRMRAPVFAFPVATAGQVAMIQNNWKLPVGSPRSLLMAIALLQQAANSKEE